MKRQRNLKEVKWMNYTKWSKRKFWIVVIGIFFLGFILAPKGTTKTVKEIVEKPVEKIVEKEVVKEVCPNENLWRELKAIDDEGFLVAARGFGMISKVFGALSVLDLDSAEIYASQFKTIAPEMEVVGDKRGTILGKLGYDY